MARGADLGEALDRLAALLLAGRQAALGFEAPIWTPRRVELDRITGRRGGVGTMCNRAWSASVGTAALGAALALMPWCLMRIARRAGPVATTVDLHRFVETWWPFSMGGIRQRADEGCRHYPP
jgi:hypothetical protein